MILLQQNHEISMKNICLLFAQKFSFYDSTYLGKWIDIMSKWVHWNDYQVKTKIKNKKTTAINCMIAALILLLEKWKFLYKNFNRLENKNSFKMIFVFLSSLHYNLISYHGKPQNLQKLLRNYLYELIFE